MVSVGVPVEDLLADPTSPAGNNTSGESKNQIKPMEGQTKLVGRRDHVTRSRRLIIECSSQFMLRRKLLFRAGLNCNPSLLCR